MKMEPTRDCDAQFGGTASTAFATEPWRDWPGATTQIRPARVRPQAVFLDRDGVINVNRSDHVKNWEEFKFLPGALDAIVRLSSAGLPLFVVTNQSVVNRGMVPRQLVEWINGRMQRVVEHHGGHITAVAYCPHRPEELCRCRKPQPGLLLSLAQRHGLDLQSSVVIGDAVSDVEAGQAAGCSTILVLTGRGRDQLALAQARGHGGFAVAEDLRAAADLVMGGTPAGF